MYKNKSLLKQIAGFVLSTVIMYSCLYEKNDEPNPAGPSPDIAEVALKCTDDSLGVVNLPAGSICFDTQILPFFQTNCAMSSCHDTKSREEGYDLSTYESIIRKGISLSNPASSKLYKVLLETGRDRMPPAPMAAVSTFQAEMVLNWIKQGAKYTACGVSVNSINPTFAKVIKPMVDVNCLGCHQPGSVSGGILLNTYAMVKVQVDNGKLWGAVNHVAGYSPMPEARKLSDCELTAIKNWIGKGAPND